MGINFEEFKLYNGISHEDCFVLDIREQFANVIYKNIAGIAALELARKIYASEGCTDYTDSELDIIRSAKSICVPQLVDSLDAVLDDKQNSK